MFINSYAQASVGVLLSAIVLTVHSAGAARLEHLSAVQLYKVENTAAPAAQPLPEPIAFFDTWDEAWEPQDHTLTYLAYTGPRLRPTGLGPGKLGLQRPRQVQWQTRSLDVPAYSNWELGVNNWRYRDEEGFSLVVGGRAASAPSWARDVRLSGLSVEQQYAEQGALPAWSYAVSVGALVLSPATQQGDLRYGATAASMTTSVEPLSNLRVDTLLENSTGLAVYGLGARYGTDYLGELQASVARSNHRYGQGWRYQASYGLELFEDTQLRWKREQYESEFADLSRYQNLASQRAGASQAWELHTTLPYLGSISTAYEIARNDLGIKDRYVGVSQQFWYSSSLRVRLQARQHLDGQNSNVALYFSLPVF